MHTFTLFRLFYYAPECYAYKMIDPKIKWRQKEKKNNKQSANTFNTAIE